MRPISPILLAGLTQCLIVFLPAQGAGARVPYDLGTERIERGEFQEAIKFFDETIEADPRLKAAYRCRAFCQLLTGNPEAAVQDFTTAIRLEPSDAVLYYGRGSAHRLLGKTKQAIADLSEAIRLHPNYRAAYLARALLTPGDAAPDFKRAGELGQLESGADLQESGRIAFDVTSIPLGRSVNLDWFFAYKYWSLLFSEQRREESRLHPPGENESNPRHQRYLAVRYATDRQFEKSFAALDRAIRLSKNDWKLYELRGTIYGAKGSLQAALTAFTKAIELNPTEPMLYEMRADVYQNLGDERHCLEDEREASRLWKTRREEGNSSGR